MAITAERMKLVNDFCALVSDNTNVLAREDIEDFLNEGMNNNDLMTEHMMVKAMGGF